MLRMEAENLNAAEEGLRQATRLVLSGLRRMRFARGDAVMKLLGERIAVHIKERWEGPDEDIKALAPSTFERRDLRVGYYKRRQDPQRVTSYEDHWWTGRSMRQALRHGRGWKTTSHTLTYDFGPNPEWQAFLGFMHYGHGKRPARPLYRKDAVKQAVDQTFEEFVSDLTSLGAGRFIFQNRDGGVRIKGVD